MLHRETSLPLRLEPVLRPALLTSASSGLTAGIQYLMDDDGGVGASLAAPPQDLFVVAEEYEQFSLPTGDPEAQTLLLNEQQQECLLYDYQGSAVAHDGIAPSVVMQVRKLI